MRTPNWNNWLDIANLYAGMMSGCTKVTVGAVIVKDNRVVSMGANRAVPDLCRYRGCLRVEKYGNNDKTHRSPADCRAIHSEVDAICTAREDLSGAVIYVTRYPCEACARAIVAAGIQTVIYGRQQEISEETARIFEDAHVDVMWNKYWDAPDVRN